MGKPLDEIVVFDEIAISALKEVGNITSCCRIRLQDKKAVMVRQEGRIYESCIIPNGDSMGRQGENYKKLEGVSEEVKKHGADLLLLPEMSFTGFQ